MKLTVFVETKALSQSLTFHADKALLTVVRILNSLESKNKIFQIQS